MAGATCKRHAGLRVSNDGNALARRHKPFTVGAERRHDENPRVRDGHSRAIELIARVAIFPAAEIPATAIERVCPFEWPAGGAATAQSCFKLSAVYLPLGPLSLAGFFLQCDRAVAGEFVGLFEQLAIARRELAVGVCHAQRRSREAVMSQKATTTVAMTRIAAPAMEATSWRCSRIQRPRSSVLDGGRIGSG